jgi:hypothetical protein
MVLKELNGLKSEVKALETKTEENAVKFASLGFKSQSDSAAYLVGEDPEVMAFCLFVDIYTLYELVSQRITGQSGFLSSLESIKKLALRSPGEAITLVSFGSASPAFFCKSGGEPPSILQSAFSKIATYDKWSDTYLDQITTALNSVEIGFRQRIENTMISSSPVRRVCELVLSESESDLRKMLDWVDKTYKKLVKDGFASTRAWSLTTRQCERSSSCFSGTIPLDHKRRLPSALPSCWTAIFHWTHKNQLVCHLN